MKNDLHIAAVVDEPQLLENMVAKLVYRKPQSIRIEELVFDNWQAANVSSTETYVSGTVMLDDENAHIALPFITSFLFSCLKNRNGEYGIEWCNSLS
jgi:hypothetical protein